MAIPKLSSSHTLRLLLFLFVGQATASSHWQQSTASHLQPPPSEPDLQPVQPTTDQLHSPPPSSMQVPVPEMKPAHISLSLKLTCDLNQRLRLGSMAEDPEILIPPQSHHIASQTSPRSEPLTIFHAQVESSDLQGAEKWGPSFHVYTRQLIEDTLKLTEEETSVVLSLAMIYLDRASSVETLRSSGIPPCPFCSGQTVHRLLFTAILTASRVVRGRPVELEQEQLDSYGLSAREVAEMMAWMEVALGDVGYFVSHEEMLHFKFMWEGSFVEEQAESPLKQHQNEQETTTSVPESSIDDQDLVDLPASTEASQIPLSPLPESDGLPQEDAADGSVRASQGFRPLPAFASRVHAHAT